MEHEKLHALVNDLLPNYIDHLTSPESDKLIEDHLAHCPRCQKALERMREEQESAMEDAIEVDYLKKVRKKGWRNVIVAVCVALLGMGLPPTVMPSSNSTFVSERVREFPSNALEL